MKIVFIISGLRVGGAETMLLKLLNNRDRRRFNPVVISLTSKGEIGPRIEKMGICVHALSFDRFFSIPLKFLRLLRLLQNIKPEVVHTWMYHADLLGGLAARIMGIRSLIWCVRNSDLSYEFSKRSTLFVIKICAKLSNLLPCKIISCSDRARAIHIDAGYCKEKFKIIPNGFDLIDFSPDASSSASIRRFLGLGGDALIVGLFARLDPQKNHIGFIEAAVEVEREIPNVHFLLAGLRVDYENIQLVREIEKAGLTNCFTLLGHRNDIPTLMASLTLLVSSSSWGEAFPNVLGEAMACGVPCVVTDVGDSAAIVGDSGRIVPAGNMTALAGSVIYLLRLSEKQRIKLGLLARQRVSENFEIVDVVRKYEDLYLEQK